MPSIPSLSSDQMREVDRLMVEDYGIALIQMMENAGRNLARLAARMTRGAAGKRMLVLAGRGNNGGGGLAAARHLNNMGVEVSVRLAADPEKFEGVPALQMSILHQMGVRLRSTGALPDDELGSEVSEADLIIDALVGYSLNGPPGGEVARLISAANSSGRAIVSLDVPSGIEASAGEVFEPAIRAAATLTLALPKTGLGQTAVRKMLGGLFLADISVPSGLYGRLGLAVPPLFADDAIVPLIWDGTGWAV